MLKKLTIIGLTAGALVLASPLAASAADSYVSPPSVTVEDPVIDRCEATTVSFNEGYFEGGEPVVVSISGANSARATVSGNTAASDGSMTLAFQPPTDGRGAYTVNVAGAVAEASSVITVAPSCGKSPAPAQNAEATVAVADGLFGNLAITGGQLLMWILGIAAAIFAAGAALFSARRKRA